MRATPGAYTRKRRKKWLKLAKGYFGKRKSCYKIAKEAVMKSLVYQYRDRRQKKRDFRKLWITRIGIACKENGISYSKFINGLSKANIILDRKILSDIASKEPEVFKKITEIVKAG